MATKEDINHALEVGNYRCLVCGCLILDDGSDDGTCECESVEGEDE